MLAPTLAATAPPPSTSNAKTVALILADDVDDVLTPLHDASLMPNLQTLNSTGLHFHNSFVTTPVCCPSRSSTVTGMYQHDNRRYRNSIAGGCASSFFKTSMENGSLAVQLQKAGVVTAFFGKCLNQCAEDAEGVAHVPTGWSKWLGLKGNSRYYDCTLSDGGQPEKHGKDYAQDYLVDLLANRSAAFLRNVSADAAVFAMIATPAAHSPYDTAPQFQRNFAGAFGKAPRTPNWNVGREGKHWLVGQHQVMTTGDIEFSDLSFRRRLITLQSLDALIGTVCDALQSSGRFEESFVIFTSDNGFHSGHWTMPDDKRLPHETDIRVPLVIRGPGLKGSTPTVALNVDLGPTIIGLVGGTTPAFMDGRSYAAELLTPSTAGATGQAKERVSFLVEHHGEVQDDHDGRHVSCATQFRSTPPSCGTDGMCKGCTKLQDAVDNTYSCLRTIDPTAAATAWGDSLCCEFFANDTLWATGTEPCLHEFYDLRADRHQLHNSVGVLSDAERDAFQGRLDELRACRGVTCL